MEHERYQHLTVNDLRKALREAISIGLVLSVTATDTRTMRREALIDYLEIARLQNKKYKEREEIKRLGPEAIARIKEGIKPLPTPETPVKADAIPDVVEVSKPKPEKIEQKPKTKSLAETIAEAVQDHIKASDINEDKVKAIVKDTVAEMVMPRRVEVKATDDIDFRDIDLAHNLFEDVLDLANDRENVWLTGPSGSGKTYLAEQVAKALKLSFHSISVGLQTSKSDLFGFIHANGDYVETEFYKAYARGGLFCLDEVDNGNANVLAMINAATSNNVCAFPCGMTTKHKDFVLIACANTYGLGADAVYVGRNQIDGATRNRFIFIEFPYDETLEDALTPDKVWLTTVRKVRRAIDELREKVIASPRASMKGSRLRAKGYPVRRVLDMLVFQGVSEEVKEKILRKAGI